MFMVGITPALLEILKYIALNGSKTPYEMTKKKGIKPLKMSEKTVRQGCHRLVESGHLQVEISKNVMGQDRKTYSLTLQGFIHALADIKRIDLNIDSIRTHWGYLLPQVFGKWEHFQKHHVENLAKDRLVAISKYMTRGSSFLLDIENESEDRSFAEEFEPFLITSRNPQSNERVFTYEFYMSNVELLPYYDHHATVEEIMKGRTEWRRACIIDDDLYAFFKKQLAEHIQSIETDLETMRSQLNEIEKLRN